MRDHYVSSTPSKESLQGQAEGLPPSLSAPLHDDVTSEASASDKTSLQDVPEFAHIDNDPHNASELEPAKENNQPGDDALELQSSPDKPKFGEKGVIQDQFDMIDHHASEPTLELGKSKIGGVSESPSDWNSRLAESPEDSLEGNWEDRAVGEVKHGSTVAGLNIDITPTISSETPEDVAEPPSIDTQIADLRDLIDKEIQPSLRTNHALVKEIHKFISNVDITQTLAELQKRKDFIRREIQAVLQLRKEEEARVIAEYEYEQEREARRAKEERQRIIDEWERDKILQAQRAKQSREELIMQLRIEQEVKEQKEKKEWEHFLLKQEMMKAEEKEKRKKAEEELEEAMRTRLAQFGFQANQIEAMANTAQKKQTNPAAMQATHPSNRQLIYTKVSKDHVDMNTLMYFDIPYKVDRANPNTIIILRELDREEANRLFEHTRRLRKPRFESRFAIEYKTDHHSTEVKINPQLRVPPFLTWPTKFDDRRDQAGIPPNQDNATLVELTLFAIEKRMTKRKFFIPDGPLQPTIIDQKLRTDFARLPEKTLEDLDPGLSSTSWNLHLQSRAFQKLAPETAFIKKARQEAGVNSSNQIFHLEDPEALSKSPQVIARRVLQWLLAHLCDETEIYVDTAQKLIDQFVPKHYTHPLLGRCWWCLEIIQRVGVFRAL